MGEKNENIILSGAFGIENIDKKTFLSKKKLESILKIKIKNKLLLVTLHPIKNLKQTLKTSKPTQKLSL